MMEPNDSPLDEVRAAALVVRTIDEIDGCGVDEREELLADLVCAAWGSVWARNQ